MENNNELEFKSNPFTPNFGQVPMHMAGRDFLISDVVEALDFWPGHPAQTSIFIGARGTGKTALLVCLSELVSARGWINASTTCGEGMLGDIYIQATRGAEHLISENRQRKLKSVNIGSVGVSWDNPSPSPSNWRSAMEDLLDALVENDTGLLITVDEVDPSIDEMVKLVATYQLLLQENKKVALLMAGLPSKVDALVTHDRISFVRRASQIRMGGVTDADVRATLVATVADGGKSISDDALDAAIEVIDGFPYMLQLVGYRMWQRAGVEKTVTLEHALYGIEAAQEDFRTRVLDTTLNELSDTDIAFLRAMLDCDAEGEECSIQAVAQKLGRTTSFATTYKNRLMQSGVIERKGRNGLRFSLPSLKEYLPEYLNLK